jgi:HEAT repeat protein
MAKRSVIVVVLFIGLVSIWMGGCQTQEQKVERLITELGHKETKVRANAAEALGQMGEGAKDAASTLIQLLQDQDQDVRYFAAGALGMIGEGAQDAVPALIQALQDQNRDVRDSAARALEKIKKFLPEATDDDDFDF